MAGNRVHHTEINVEGVVAERKEAAVEEVRWFLRVLDRVSKKAKIERVIIAKDFDATINRLSSVHKAYGIEYKAQRRSVRAAAKVLVHIENDNISFSLVFDGNTFGNWEASAKGLRFEKFLHELSHIALYDTRFEKVGTERFYANENTAEGVCFSLALTTRDEYVVDRVVDKLCQEFLTDEHHQPVHLAKLHMAEGVDFRVVLAELMGKMPGFIRQNVRDFKLWRKTIEALWPEILQFLEELLTVFAHCAATYDGLKEWGQIFADISATEAYRAFLRGHLERIHEEWQKWFSEPHYDEAGSLDVIQNRIREIFRNCGLTLTNVSDGIYVSVDFIWWDR